MFTLILLNIIAAVCLLLWGLRHLRHGMVKGFGSFLRRVLQAGTQNPVSAALCGIIITLMVQSSTATVLLSGTFISQGFVSLSSGVALALGADLGTALAAAVLSLDLRMLMPIMIILGFMLYSFQNKPLLHNLGRVFSGLGLMLLALTWIKDVTVPLSHSDTLSLVVAPMESDPVFGIILAAILTWLFHSSLAMILLVVSLCGSDLIHPDFALYLVLGANLGGAFPALIASWTDQKSVRVPLANTIVRFAGVALFFPLMPVVSEWVTALTGPGPSQVVGFHVFFNMALCICALPFTGLLGKLAETLRPELPLEEDIGQARYLDKDFLDTPSIALSNCARETLRLAEIVQRMLQRTMRTFEKNDDALVRKIREEDHVVDRLYGTIKHYLARLLAREELTEEQATRAVHILMFATNLEHTGDVIDKNLMPLAEKKNRLHHDLSDAGLEEIREFHGLVLDSLIQAQQVFMSSDQVLAQKMITQKRNEIREAEERATGRHIQRLRDGVPETVATSSLHLDIIRDFRRINTYSCSVAYEILKEKSLA